MTFDEWWEKVGSLTCLMLGIRDVEKTMVLKWLLRNTFDAGLLFGLMGSSQPPPPKPEDKEPEPKKQPTVYMTTCLNCDGRGGNNFGSCHFCNGSGSIQLNETEARDFMIRRRFICHNCNGKGLTPNGHGQLAVMCMECNTTGIRRVTCPDCGGTGDETSDGQGKCSTCQGKKKVPANMKCRRCEGRGQLHCWKCSNEGCSDHGLAVNGPCVAGDPCPDCNATGYVGGKE